MTHEDLAAQYCATVSQNVALAEGYLFESFSECSMSAKIKRSVKDIDFNKIRTFLYEYEIETETGNWKRLGFEREISDYSVYSFSPSGKKLATFKKVSNESKKESAEYEVEVWNNDSDQGISLASKFSTKTSHGEIMMDGWFGDFNWSPDESCAVYVAQKPLKTSLSFFSPPEEGKAVGDQFLYKEDWGEKYAGVFDLSLYIVNFENHKVAEVPNIDPSLCPGQPQWAKQGTYIVYTAWKTLPRKLGIIYCYQRSCGLFSANVSLLALELSINTSSEKIGKIEIEHKAMTQNDILALFPRISKCGEKLVWLSRKEGFSTHSGAFRLALGNLSDDGQIEAQKNLVDITVNPASDEEFPGLWSSSLPSACWAKNNSEIFLSSNLRSRECVLKINADDGKVEIVNEGKGFDESLPKSSASVLSVGSQGRNALISFSNPNSPKKCAVYLHNGKMICGPDFGPISITKDVKVPKELISKAKQSFEGLQFEVLKFKPKNENLSFEAILIKPNSSEKVAFPLIVIPHGGPHSAHSTSFVAEYAFLCGIGYALLLVNYRGSTGFGEGPLNSLPKNIGTHDVDDMVQATREVCGRDDMDENRVALWGGSHGGFLACHLTSLFPDMFKVAMIRNPVVNLASMVTSSDIPDWCYVETLGQESFKDGKLGLMNAEDLNKMAKVSPILNVKNVKAATLLGLGAKDRRVPHSQGLEWFNALRANEVTCKLLFYPEDTHALDKPGTSADFLLNAVLWL
eukprot:CAMPEP_0171459608 /NCGR_PEP_ID=MMETSP0945-20130129/4823_1 /TAXON_ID=109269 /ORGANISM="Vaucheria litorea, Strain CCMP2940" /LENGTH=742 /DNA_ID=CAMNT_0011985659 /DNA_START=140 /DNA_END=2364 /DNA_ORIENTATION=-